MTRLESNTKIRRDIMAVENMVDLLVYEINGLSDQNIFLGKLSTHVIDL
jgi:hypothetical protein